jgi:hypothetical protein
LNDAKFLDSNFSCYPDETNNRPNSEEFMKIDFRQPKKPLQRARESTPKGALTRDHSALFPSLLVVSTNRRPTQHAHILTMCVSLAEHLRVGFWTQLAAIIIVKGRLKEVRHPSQCPTHQQKLFFRPFAVCLAFPSLRTNTFTFNTSVTSPHFAADMQAKNRLKNRLLRLCRPQS